MLTLKLSELATMTKPQREAALADLVRAAKEPRNGEARVLDERIHEFEVRYEMTSEQMLERLAAGELHDTADIVRWTMLLYARDRG